MRKLLLSTVALVGFAGVASAADLPRRAIAPVVPLAPAFTWTGFYIGVNAGAAFQTEDDEDDLFGSDQFALPRGSVRNAPNTAGTLTFLDSDFSDDEDEDVGFSGGGQIGFNYQFTPGQGFVVGVEADIQYIDLNSDNENRNGGGRYRFVGVGGEAFTNPNNTPLVVRGRRDQGLGIDAFGTVRGRIGYAFDRTLIYATGGFAYGFGGDDNDNDIFDDSFDNGDEDDFKFGYAVGGGVEFALSNFSLFGSSTATFKIEGLYVNLEEDDNNRDGFRATFNRGANTLRLNERQAEKETEFAVVRAGINFKF